MQNIAHLIGGEMFSTSGSQLSPVFNPATCEQITKLELANHTGGSRHYH